MKRYVLFAALSLLCFALSHATWSIIIIDPKTNEIGIAGASCTYNCYGIRKIIPNMGAVVVQAMSNSNAREKGVEMIVAEASPEQIIMAMRDSLFDPERQQYAIVTIKHIDNPATYTGTATTTYNGTLTARGISIQGNTLTNPDELNTILETVLKGQSDSLHIADILMNALEAGSNAGGDKRCEEQKATSAFLIVAKPYDKKPYLNLSIFGQGKGKQNAVTMLRKKFQKWKGSHQF